VLGPGGAPVANTEIVLEGPLGTSHREWTDATTDANGTFHLRVPAAGSYRATRLTSVRRSIDDNARIEIPSTGRSGVEIHLEGRGEIVGTVVDSSGNPVAGTWVTATASELAMFTPAHYGVTDTRGRFVFHDLDGSIDLIARHDQRASSYRHVEVGANQRAELVLQIGAAGISGVVVDSQGAPVANADVYLDPGWSPVEHEGMHVDVDDQGRFAIDVPQGNFRLSVRATSEDDYDDANDRTVAGGTHNARLVIP
jgi:hypothetical protein